MATTGATPRPATAADLPAAARVYLRAAAERGHRLYGLPLPPPTEDELATGEGAAVLADLVALQAEGPDRVWVAEQAGWIVGVAAGVVRDRQCLIDYLFVLPEAQGRGLGRALLDRLRAAAERAGCRVCLLVASPDPRALTLYLGAGFVPQPPLLDLRAAPDRLRLPAPNWDDGLEATPLRADDPAHLATLGDIDRVVRGARRPADLSRWLAAGATGALLLRRDTGAPAGYYLVGGGQDDDHLRLGPLAVLDAERQPAALGRALAAAAPLHAGRPAAPWRATVPGQNATATAALLAAGFRPLEVATLLATVPLPTWDRYVTGQEDYL